MVPTLLDYITTFIVQNNAWAITLSHIIIWGA